MAAAEATAEASRWATPSSEEQHCAAIRDPSLELHVIEADGERAGHVLLAALTAKTGVELRRIVVGPRDRGIGSAALPLVLDHCFRVLGTHRVWLDVLPENARARAVYRRVGFREEGVMRDALRWPDGLHTLVLMAVLESEWRTGRPAGAHD